MNLLKGNDELLDKVFDWPGNVRELKNVLNRAAILSDSETIGPEDLPAELSGAPYPLSGGPLPTLDAMERAHISLVLGHTGGQRKKAARILGIDVKTLYRKIKKHCLDG